MKVENYFKKGEFYVWKERFAIIKSKKLLQNAFGIIKDKNEITVIINQSKIKSNKDVIKIDKNWKIITFDMVLPFELVGFISKISKILADAGIGIFVISSFSTDHVLVKEKDLDKAINKLKSIGFIKK